MAMFRWFVMALLITAVPAICQPLPNKPKQAPITHKTTFYGLAYGPFSGKQNPASGLYPSTREIDSDLAQIATRTKRIRVYGCTRTLAEIPRIAKKYGVECLAGCWISRDQAANEAETKALVEAARKDGVSEVVIGNEVLLRGDLTHDQLVDHIRRVKKQTRLKVAYADTWSTWLANPELVEEVDTVLVHIYGYWDGVPVESAAKYVVDRYDQVCKTYPSKRIVIGEVGWPMGGPKRGGAQPGVDQQKQFVQEFIRIAADRHIPYYYFEAYCEEWKAADEAGVGPFWGLYDMSRPAR